MPSMCPGVIPPAFLLTCGIHAPSRIAPVFAATFITRKVQTVNFVKRTSGGGGDLPPPPEPPAIEGQGLSVPAPPHDLKVTMSTRQF